MSKRALLIALVLAAAMAARLAAAGTLAERWSAVLDDAPPQALANAASTVTKLVAMRGGGAVALRSFTLENAPAGVQLVRLSATGSKLWHWSVYGVVMGLDVAATSGGGLAVAARSWRAGKAQYELWLFDDSGKLVWRRDVPIAANDDMWLTANVVPQADGDVLFLGRAEEPGASAEPLVFDFAVDGETRWSWPLGGAAVGAVPDGEGFLVRIDHLSGALRENGQQPEHPQRWLVAVGPNGKELRRAQTEFHPCTWGLAAIDGVGIQLSFDPCVAATASDAAAVWIDRLPAAGQALSRIKLPIANPRTDCLLVLGKQVSGSFFGDGAGMAKHHAAHGSCDLMIVSPDTGQTQTATMELARPARSIAGVLDSSGHFVFVAGDSEPDPVVEAFDVPR